ncbi:MAG: hypothetical protein LYZ70_02510 [Nitrososphaerales archaeon]|nr:hypothetical protein [Nitrososphaerales archaeon]
MSNVIYHPSGPYGALPYPCAAGSQAEHVHPYLRIVIDGQNVTIPGDVGILGGGSCLEPIHTHDASGILHIEPSAAGTQFTLNDFFQIWKSTFGNVSINGIQHPTVFNSTDILGFRADSTHNVTLLVDGHASKEWGSLALNQLDYCNANTTGPPCKPTALGEPYWNGKEYPYGTLHTIVIVYNTVSR